MKRDPSQMDFFSSAVYPSRTAVDRIDIDLFRLRLSSSIARALDESPYDRQTIAALMAQYLGLPSVSKASLDAYAAASKNSHDISLVRFKALTRATGATWLWDMVVKDDGLIMLEGDEARLAEIARLRQEQRKLAAELKALEAKPVTIRRGRK